MRMVDFGGRVYLVKFIHLGASYMIFGFWRQGNWKYFEGQKYF